MEFVSVFDEAGRDYEAEIREQRLTAATVEAQPLWGFLALAQSREEFGHRLALREDRLSAIAAKHGVSYEDVTGPLVKGFEAIHTEAREEDWSKVQGAEAEPYCSSCSPSYTRVKEPTASEPCKGCGGVGWSGKKSSLHEAKGLECRRCNHSNGPHTQGAACTCGCTTFQPKVMASKSEHTGAACPECGKPGEEEHTNEGVYRGSVCMNLDCSRFGRFHDTKKTSKITSRKIAGRDEWEHDCVNCGTTSTSTKEHMDCPSCGEKAEEIYTSYKGKTSSVTAAQRGPSYDRDSVRNLPLNGTKSNPGYYYDEGYDHGRSGTEYKGYGGRDMAILYGHGYKHGKQDYEDAGHDADHLSAGDASANNYFVNRQASKTAAGNPDCLTGYGTQDPSNCSCASCLRHPDSQMSDADKSYHEQVNNLTDRNNPNHPDYNDFDPNTHHQDMYGEGFRTHNVNGHTVHEFASTAQGYNHSQTSDKIKDGDVLSVPSEGVHGFMYQAWPVASTEAHGEFHGADMEGLLGENPQYRRAHEVAQSLAHIQPKDAAWQGRLSRLHQALMDGQDPLAWIVQQNPSGGPQYALVPSGHDTVQQFPADGDTGGAPNALDQALDNAGSDNPQSEHRDSQKEGSRPF